VNLSWLLHKASNFICLIWLQCVIVFASAGRVFGYCTSFAVREGLVAGWDFV
jgi:hypothetical protein